MEYIIPFESRYVNAFLFVVVDIIGLWAIHRGLHALQGYYMYRRARGGYHVQIARSRVPILSGELLRGATRLPSVFVIANTIAMSLAFLGTLGVNGEMEPLWVPIELTNSTTLAGFGRLHPEVLPSRILWKRFQTCTERNDTHMIFWQVAFNTSMIQQFHEEKRNTNILVASNFTCQKHAPQAEPVMSIKCFDPFSSTCDVMGRSEKLMIRLQLDNRIHDQTSKKQDNDSIVSYNVTMTNISGRSKSENSFIMNQLKGHLIVGQRDSSRTSKRGALLVVFDPSQEMAYFTVGYIDSLGADFAKLVASGMMLVTPSKLLNWNSNYFLSLTSLLGKLEVPLTWTVLESGIKNALLPTATNRKKYNEVLRSVTVIKREAMWIFALLIVVAIVFCFLKEIILYLLTRNDKVLATEVYTNDFDSLSRIYRARMEQVRDLPLSNDFAILGLYKDLTGTTRVGATTPVPVPHIPDPNLDGRNLQSWAHVEGYS